MDNRTTLGTPPDGIDAFSAWPIAARCGENNGSIILKYPLSSAGKLYEFSIDGGLSYPYASPEGTSEMKIDGLPAGIYNVWVRNEDDSFPVDLGPYTIFDAEPSATVSAGNTTCRDDGSIVFLINDLPYAGKVQISIDSGANYNYNSSPGIWKDTIGDLPQGGYPVWIRYEDGSCPVELAKVSISTSLDSLEVYPMLDGVQNNEQPDTLMVCPGSSLYLICFPSDGELQWSVTGPGEFSSDSRITLISTALTGEMFGSYDISYRTPGGCELFKTLVLVEGSECATGSAVYPFKEAVEIFPNPAEDKLTVSNRSGQQLMLDIVNLGGAVLRKHLAIEEGEQRVDLAQLPEGLYFFVLSDELGNRITRSIINKLN
jgi:hypothetical protein